MAVQIPRLNLARAERVLNQSVSEKTNPAENIIRNMSRGDRFRAIARIMNTLAGYRNLTDINSRRVETHRRYLADKELRKESLFQSLGEGPGGERRPMTSAVGVSLSARAG